MSKAKSTIYVGLLLQLKNSVEEAKPLLEHYENQLASSLSCDSRSNDNDKEPRKLLLNLLNSLNEVKSYENKQ